VFYRKLRRIPLCSWLYWLHRVASVFACSILRTYVVRLCTPTNRHDLPTWRMSSRAIKGPVGKRLMTICPEHVSGRPPGNKGPLKTLSSLFLCSRTTRSFLSTYGRRQSNGTACEPRVNFSLSLSPFLSLSLSLSPLSLFFSLLPCASVLARRSGLRFLRGTRLRSPAASCLPHFSLTHLLFPFRRPTHYRTSPSDCPPWSRSFVASRFQRAIVFEGDRLSSFRQDISNLHS